MLSQYNELVNMFYERRGKMKKYVIVGGGTRGILSYAVPMVKEFGDVAELCGVYDINYKRAKLVSDYVGREIPVFDSFEKMLEETKPDTVIVTTVDAFHDFYTIKALYAGCDVISEKPLTTTFEKALAIKKAEEETGKRVTVTFNLRFNPAFRRVKEIISSGVIGDVLSVHYQWMLDTAHGADYFRRWHRQKKNSGSLMVHKSTHHFDLANWYLDDEPESINAFGTCRFYGPITDKRGVRCRGCTHASECKYYIDIEKDAMLKKFYLDCEDVDGYFRDGCVFSPDIDIQDSVSVNVKYKKGAVMSYSLTAHSPLEGCNMVINGTEGRLEFSKYWVQSADYSEISDRARLKIYNRQGEEITVLLPKEDTTGHGGSDALLLKNLFRGFDSDPLCQMADLRAGMMSIGIGMAANVSMAENRQVRLDEFYK